MPCAGKMKLATHLGKNRRSKMTYKRFSRGLGCRYTPQKMSSDPQKIEGAPQPVRRTQPPNGSQALRCKPRAIAQGIGLQRRYPIWGLRACPQNNTMLRCHFAVRQRMPKSFNLLVSFSHEATSVSSSANLKLGVHFSGAAPKHNYTTIFQALVVRGVKG